MLTARVLVGTPPDIPPDPLVEFVAPVVTSTGQLTDWELVPERVLTDHPDARSAVHRFSAWRAQWVRVFPLGPDRLFETLRSFLSERRDSAVPFGAFERLNLSGDTLDFARIATLGSDTERARLVVTRATDSGWGITDASPKPRPGLLVAAAPLWGPESLAHSDTLDVTARALEGIVVSWSDKGAARSLVVTGWELVEDSIRLFAENDTTARLYGLDATTVMSLAPTSIRVKVRPAPLSSVWAPPLSGLQESCRFASNTHSNLIVGPPSHTGELIDLTSP